MSNELIERLRDWSDGPGTDDLCREAAAEIEALKADAERYRWIKLMKVGRNPEFAGYWMFWSTPPLKGETFDAAIDAAIKAGKAVTP